MTSCITSRHLAPCMPGSLCALDPFPRQQRLWVLHLAMPLAVSFPCLHDQTPGQHICSSVSTNSCSPKSLDTGTHTRYRHRHNAVSHPRIPRLPGYLCASGPVSTVTEAPGAAPADPCLNPLLLLVLVSCSLPPDLWASHATGSHTRHRQRHGNVSPARCIPSLPGSVCAWGPLTSVAETP